MKILVTGARGFVGKNLIAELKNRGYEDILECDVETTPAELELFTRDCEFVYHLAGVNRPPDEAEFMRGNFGFTTVLLENLKKNNNRSPILMTSSVQAELENPYGKSKKAGEDHLFAYGTEHDVRVLIYRLPNLFGKWCRPNYNSVTATFCHNIARNLPVTIHDPQTLLRLCYIDDVAAEFIRALEGQAHCGSDGFCQVTRVYEIRLGELADKLHAFAANRTTLVMPSVASELDRALYATWLSYLPAGGFSYPLEMRRDDRGWLAEFIKSDHFGQIFISKTKPGITRGNHWHHTKVEKFAVIQGEAVIKFRPMAEDGPVQEYPVSGDRIEVVDIPPGYTHSITNVGETEVITLFWADEIFNPDKMDTYFAQV